MLSNTQPFCKDVCQLILGFNLCSEHMARYSASPVDLETVDCFLLFHETRF
ncbi:hypothetical protein HanPSC8_Chr05g0186651 [Helianthus annuus]|nr:hypothetical protein HanPSC8_Chr05g0186651 [Helianthus annuus]